MANNTIKNHRTAAQNIDCLWRTHTHTRYGANIKGFCSRPHPIAQSTQTPPVTLRSWSDYLLEKRCIVYREITSHTLKHPQALRHTHTHVFW